jgi:hypothetical protein
LFAIPCIIGQLCQIFIGSVVVRYYQNAVDLENKTKNGDEDKVDVEQDDVEKVVYNDEVNTNHTRNEYTSLEMITITKNEEEAQL